MERLHARYPFLEAAKAAVEAADVDLAELIMDERSPVLERAIERVEGAVHDGRVPDPVADTRVELLSYPVARVLVSLIDDPVLTDRYALAEARRAFELLRTDLEDRPELKSTSTDRLTMERLLTEFELEGDLEEHEDEYRLSVTAFLALSTELRGAEWRLVTRGLADGLVPITRPELETLMREAIRKRVAERLPLEVPDRIASALAAEVSAIEDSLADVRVPDDITTVTPDLFPACMDALLERARNEDPLDDVERFALVSFLMTIGASVEEVLELTETSETTEADLIRYQAEHLHGENRSTAYPPPSCETLQAYGICVDTPERCEHIGHPVTAYAERLPASAE